MEEDYLTLGGTLAVANGGTGATTLSSGYLVKGNGTSAVSASVVYDNGTNVGIGTSSPTAKLDVRGTSYVIGTGGTRVSDAVGENGFEVVPAATNNVLSYNRTTSSYLPIRWRAGVQSWEVDNTERMRITSTGLVGIGTSSPTSKLDVNGDISIGNGYGLYLHDSGGSSYPSIAAPAVNAIGFSLSGSEVMRLNGTGLGIGTTTPAAKLDVSAGNIFLTQDYELQWKAGAATRAAIRGTSADTLNFYTRIGGAITETMRIDANGNFGIGTASNGRRLEVWSGAAQTDILTGSTSSGFGTVIRWDNSGGQGFIYNTGAYPLLFGTNSTERMRISSTGDVGVNGASPGTKFYVNGGVAIHGASFPSSGVGMEMLWDGTQSVVQSYNRNVASYQPLRLDGSVLQLFTSGTEKARITSGGDFGIGTSSPAAKLHVSTGTTTNAIAGNAIAGFTSNANAVLSVNVPDANAAGLFFGYGGNPYWAGIEKDGSTSLRFVFAGAERMRIISNGNVGIGATSPEAALSVFNAATFNARTSGVNVHRPSSYGQYGSFAYDGDTTYFSTTYTGGGAGVYGKFIFQAYDSTSTPAERMRIDASGQVGIGTASPTTKLTAYNGTSRTLIRAASDLNFSGAYLGTASSTNRGASLELVGHLDGNNSASWRTAVAVDLFGGLADMVFSYAGSSSTYAGLSYSEKMRVTTPGNLLVGSSTDFGGRLTLIPTTNPTTASVSANQIAIGESTSNTGYRLNVGYILVSGSYYAGSIQSIAGSTGAPLLLNADGGNVGIGTYAPSVKLDVVGANNDGLQYRTSTRTVGIGMQANEAAVYWGSGTRLDFTSGGAIFLTIAATTGNVGIGTSSPAHKLEVSGNTRVPLTNSYYAYTQDYGMGTPDSSGLQIFTGLGDTIRFGRRYDGTFTEYARIDSSGNLLVGGTSALQSAKITAYGSVAAQNGGVDGAFANAFVGVYSANSNEHNVIQTAVSSVGTSSGFRFRASLGGGSSTTYPVLDLTRNQTIFYTDNAERMRIDNAGNVAIGTTNTGYGRFVAYEASNSILSIANATSYAGLQQNAADLYINVNQSGAAGGNLVFRRGASSVESMRIDSSGNVGINATPSPWSSGYRALQIAGQGAGLFANVTSSQAVLGSNGYYNGTNWIYNNSDTAGQYWIDGNVHKWFNASGGSAGSTISFTERMRIDSSGNLLVGKSSLTNETTTDGFVYYKNASGGGSTLYATNGGNGTAMALSVQADTNAIQFFRSGTLVGSVSLTTTNTAYNTSSDYRLKEIDGPIANSGAYIDALKPVQGSWKADGSRFIGLLAHEVQEVSETPIATGDKDGEKMQAMDYSAPELIANLIAEIQSLRAREGGGSSRRECECRRAVGAKRQRRCAHRKEIEARSRIAGDVACVCCK